MNVCTNSARLPEHNGDYLTGWRTGLATREHDSGGLNHSIKPGTSEF